MIAPSCAETCQGCAFPPEGARTAAATTRATASSGVESVCGSRRVVGRPVRCGGVVDLVEAAVPRRRGPCRTAIPRQDRSGERLRPPTSRSVRLRRPTVARSPGCFLPRPGMRPSVATAVRHPSCGGHREPCPCSATPTAPRGRRRQAGHEGSAAAAPDRIARRPRSPRSPVAIRTGILRSRAAWRTRTLVSSESHSSTRMSMPSRNPSTDSSVIPRSNTSTGR